MAIENKATAQENLTPELKRYEEIKENLGLSDNDVLELQKIWHPMQRWLNTALTKLKGTEQEKDFVYLIGQGVREKMRYNLQRIDAIKKKLAEKYEYELTSWDDGGLSYGRVLDKALCAFCGNDLERWQMIEEFADKYKSEISNLRTFIHIYKKHPEKILILKDLIIELYSKGIRSIHERSRFEVIHNAFDELEKKDPNNTEKFYALMELTRKNVTSCSATGLLKGIIESIGVDHDNFLECISLINEGKTLLLAQFAYEGGQSFFKKYPKRITKILELCRSQNIDEPDSDKRHKHFYIYKQFEDTIVHYGDDDYYFEKLCVLMAGKDASRITEKLRALYFAKEACMGKKKRFDTFITLDDGAISELSSVGYAYGDDDEMFDRFVNFANNARQHAIEALAAASPIYKKGKEFDEKRFQLFVTLLKERNTEVVIAGTPIKVGQYGLMPNLVQMVAQAHKVYTNNDWRLGELLELVQSSCGERAVEILAHAVDIYGDNDDIFKEFLQIVKRENGAGIVKRLIKVKNIFRNDHDKFLEFIQLATIDCGSSFYMDSFFEENIIEAYQDSDEIFEEFRALFLAKKYEQIKILASCKHIYKNKPLRFTIILDLMKNDREETVIALKACCYSIYQDERFEECMDLVNRNKLKELKTLVYLTNKIFPDKERFQFFLSIVETESDYIVRKLVDAHTLYAGKDNEMKYALFFVKHTTIIDEAFVFDNFCAILKKSGEEIAVAYLEDLHKQAKGLIPVASEELRAKPEYMYMVKYVFPKGNYSTYEKNLACGDHLEHLEGYGYDKAGYPVELTGLLGYRLKSSVAEGADAIATALDRDEGELEKYKTRTDRIREFVGSRGPDNEALQKTFDEKVDQIFEIKAHERFRAIEGLSMKEKLLTLFISEAHRRTTSGGEYETDTEVLDLVIEYKYAYNENLEAYFQRTADTAKSQPDRASKCYSYWSELSVLYGENVKHVLRHDIFESLAEGGEHYGEIVEGFGQLFEVKTEAGFELNARQKLTIERILAQQNFDSEQLRFDKLVDKLLDDLSSNKPLEPVEPSEPQKPVEGAIKDDTRKYEKQLKVYTEQKAAYEKRLVEYPEALKKYNESNKPLRSRIVQALNPIRDNLSLDTIEAALQKTFPIDPSIEKRIDSGIFQNSAIPLDDVDLGDKIQSGKFAVLLKQCRGIFGANIKFEDQESRDRCNRRIEEIIEPCREDLTMNRFQEILPRLQSLRKEYRFDVNTKLEELFSIDINRIFKELHKYEEVVEEEAKEQTIGGTKDKTSTKSAKKRRIRGYFTKTRESANARMGAYLCIAGDPKMYRKNKNYFEKIDQDEDTGECTGLTMFLNIKTANKKKYLWFGPNPFESFLDKVSSKACYDYMYNTAIEFAKKNGYDAIVVPPKDEQILGQCTNRGGDFPEHIKNSRIKDVKGNLITVDFGAEYELGGGYKYSSGAVIWQKEEKAA